MVLLPFQKPPLPRKKTTTTTTTTLEDYYSDWIAALETTHLPLLRHHISASAADSTINLLRAHSDILYHHLHSHYLTLDAVSASEGGAAHLLSPSAWRNPLEIPFLWFGDLHPYLFTTLLRSFLLQNDDEDDVEDDEGEEREMDEEGGVLDDVIQSEGQRRSKKIGNVGEVLMDQEWAVKMAWAGPDGKKVWAKVGQIDRGLRLMVPALMDRARKAQSKFVDRVGEDENDTGDAVVAEMEEMVGVVMEANRLRREVLGEILSVTSVLQGALFLEGLAQFLVGLRDEKVLAGFKKSKIVVKK